MTADFGDAMGFLAPTAKIDNPHSGHKDSIPDKSYPHPEQCVSSLGRFLFCLNLTKDAIARAFAIGQAGTIL